MPIVLEEEAEFLQARLISLRSDSCLVSVGGSLPGELLVQSEAAAATWRPRCCLLWDDSSFCPVGEDVGAFWLLAFKETTVFLSAVVSPLHKTLI